jgi:hypothetical protein
MQWNLNVDSSSYCYHRGVQLLITPRKLSFALGNFEPFYGVLALYDMAKRVKISENFYFDVNDDDVLSPSPLVV